ncbi:hypothetical protein WA026_009669 [Henosepilachna vigintioctopunctata]
MMHKELLRSLFFVLIVGSMTVSMQSTKELSNRVPLKRTTPKPGFIKTVFQAAYEQWTDTRDTLNKINKMLNDNFIPESAVSSTTVASTDNSDPNATTTRAPYRITRNEFSRILRRNVNGLVRLFNLELADALKESRATDREFRKNATREFSKFL